MVLFAVAAAALVAWMFWPRETGTNTSSVSPEPTPDTPPSPTTSAPIEPPPPAPEPVIADFAADLERAVLDAENPEAHRQAVEQVLFFYRRAFGENPVGQNEDITAALLGANPQRLAFLPHGSAAIAHGQLVDPWGTPYWFHPLSGHEMEIRSAGPDRELFTPDDVGEGGEPEEPRE